METVVSPRGWEWADGVKTWQIGRLALAVSVARVLLLIYETTVSFIDSSDTMKLDIYHGMSIPKSLLTKGYGKALFLNYCYSFKAINIGLHSLVPCALPAINSKVKSI